MKKKYLIIILLLLVSFGCTMGSSPSAKVEEVLKRYNTNSDVVKAELGDYLNTLDLDQENRTAYQDVYLRQYSDLTYEIKDERIDGDNAVVTVQIKVYDYYSAENTINHYVNTHQADFNDENGNFSDALAYKYRIDELNKVKDRIDYTVEFNLTKVNKEWVVDNLSNEQLQKIHGTYVH